MRWSADEAGGSRRDPFSSGLPRGTQIDSGITPQAPDRTPSGSAPAQHHGSSADHRSTRVRTTDRSPGSQVLARTPHPTSDAVASALAHALLAVGDWTAPSLLAALQHACGARRRWLPALVREVLEVYQRPPRDAPRELAAVIHRSVAFDTAVSNARAQGRPLSLAHWIAEPRTRTSAAAEPLGPASAAAELLGPASAAPEPLAPAPAAAAPPTTSGTALATSSAGLVTGPLLPHLPTVGALASLLDMTIGELDWLADVGGWNRRARPGPLHHYRYEWRPRPGRVPRLLEVPADRMLAAQRTLLHELLALVPVHSAAHGFVPGRSALTGARVHVGASVVIGLDLTTFFVRVGAGQVYETLRRAGYAERVALALTGLVTNRVPPRVLTAMPPGGDAGERFALRQALAMAHLPQGAPSSPALANLSLRRLDARLDGYAERADARYTRYADDLSFSGGTDLRRRSDAFVRGIRRIVAAEGHLLNDRKTRVRPAATSQRVTGIVVNEHPALVRSEFDRLKAMLHNCAGRGPETQNRAQHPDLRAHLLGRISWARTLNPAKAERLQREFDRIDWSAQTRAE